MADRTSSRSRAVAWLGGVAAGLAALVLALAIGDPLEQWSRDWRMAWREPPARGADPGVVLVAVSDRTYQSLAEPRIFWGRHFARVLERLSDAGARVIGIDLIPATPVDRYAPELDEAFAAALAGTRNVVMTYQRVTLPDGTVQTLAPHDQLVGALLLGGGTLGHNHLSADEDQIVRRWRLAVPRDEGLETSFPLALVSRVLGHEPDRGMSGGRLSLGAGPLDSVRELELRINFRGPPGTYPAIPFEQLALAEALEPAQRELLRGAVAIVGSVSVADQDVHPAPSSDDRLRALMPGIELHANVVDSLLADDGLRTPSGRLIALGSAVAVALAAWAFAYAPFAAGLGALATFGALWAWAMVAALAGGLLLPLAAPAGALLGSFGGTWATRAWLSAAQKREIRGLFERYVPKAVVDALIANPGLARLDGERREITVLFSDIRNFTSLSEGMDAGELSRLLNRYLTRMTEILLRHGATIDKYMGDGIMAIFGAPLAAPDDAQRAVRCATEMIESLEGLREEWMQEGVEGAEVFDIGIGVHTGEAFVGNVGAPERMEYTAIGDTVNVAARLESANKDQGTNLLVSDATWSRVRGMVEGGTVRELQVKGRKQAVKAHEIVGFRGEGRET